MEEEQHSICCCKSRTYTPHHPPYAEMVRSALSVLSEKDGSTMASISSFIVSNYSGLPIAHDSFLPYYLRKLLHSGDVAISSSSSSSSVPRFCLPNTREVDAVSTLPPRRGRGRPRKNPKPKLILRLKRTDAGSWHCCNPLDIQPPLAMSDAE